MLSSPAATIGQGPDAAGIGWPAAGLLRILLSWRVVAFFRTSDTCCAAPIGFPATPMWFIRRKRTWGARPPAPLDFRRHKSGVQWYLPTVSQNPYTGAVWRNGVGLCSRRKRDKGYPGSGAPMARQAPDSKRRQGPFLLLSHWTPDPCLKKSSGEAAVWPASPAQVRFSRSDIMHHSFRNSVFLPCFAG
jgi:hypothetical protein